MRMRPWFTLDQEGTALMFHSWLECSAKGPVFIWKRVHEVERWPPGSPALAPLQGQACIHTHTDACTHKRTHIREHARMGTGPHTHTGTQKCQRQGSPLTCKVHWENISPTVTLFLPQPKKAGTDSHDPLNRATSEKSNLHPSSRCGSLRVPEPQKVPPAQRPSPIQISAGAAWIPTPQPSPTPRVGLPQGT